MRFLVTGSAGFIGYHVSLSLLQLGHEVVGIDNFNSYYDTNLKENRNKLLAKSKNFMLYRGDVANLELVKRVFEREKFDQIIHLAAQAGVRYSITNPQQYIQANIVGFFNVLDQARLHEVSDFLYASSGSVYGHAKKYPTQEIFDVKRPVSLYAATKACNEIIAYDYAMTFKMNCVGLRFFTVYGPWGRPDMAIWLFTNGIAKGTPIDVYNNGEMERDFTYIDDLVRGILLALKYRNGFDLFNIGSGQSVKLTEYINCIENELGKKAKIKYQPMQTGDVKKSYADISKAREKLGYEPKVMINEGINKYVQWYREYYLDAN